MGKGIIVRVRSWLKHTSYILAGALTRFREPEFGEAAVLMYHAVDDSGWRLAISPTEFNRQMAYLRRHRVVVPLKDVVAFVKGEKHLPQKAVAITFDDGYADLVPTVLPILKKYRIPITLFLTTDVHEQTNSLGTPRVTWDDVRELKASGLVSIQSHGRTHPHLPALSPEEVMVQLNDARNALKSEIDEFPSYFAYPFGDRTLEVDELVKESGHEAAFSIAEGFVRQDTDRFRIPRIQVDATMTPLLFGLRLSPALDKNRRIVDRVRRVLSFHTR